MAFKLPNRQFPIADRAGKITTSFYRWFEQLIRDILENFRIIAAILDGLGADTSETSAIITSKVKAAARNQFFQVETDDDPPALPSGADATALATIRCKRSSGVYEDYVYTP